MRTHYRWVRWGTGVYVAVALACTAAWLVLGPQAAERTGLQRELFLANRFAGPPLRSEVSDGISLDFLDEDTRFSPATLQRPVARLLVRPGGRPYRDPWSWRRLA